jgi:hypothetical protein
LNEYFDGALHSFSTNRTAHVAVDALEAGEVAVRFHVELQRTDVAKTVVTTGNENVRAKAVETDDTAQRSVVGGIGVGRGLRGAPPLLRP